MRIGVDLSSLTPVYGGGKEQAVINLLRGWQDNGWGHELTLFLHSCRAEQIRHWVPDARIVIMPERNIKFEVLFFRSWDLPRLIHSESIDLLLFPHPETGFGRFTIPTAVIPHDIQFIEYPEQLGWYQRCKTRFLYGLDFKLRDGIVAISNFDLETIKTYYPRSASKLKRIYNPVVFRERAEAAEAKESGSLYILLVNVSFKHKNAETVIRAFEKITHEIPHRLVIAGSIQPETQYLVDLVEKSPASGKIELLGHVGNEQLEDLYQNCTVFVTASTYEGFGMTAVEAMGNKVPVVSSRKTALPEVTFESAYYYEPVMDAGSLAQMIMQVIKSLPEKERLEDLQMRAMETYDYRVIAGQYRNWFLEILEAQHKAEKSDGGLKAGVS